MPVLNREDTADVEEQITRIFSASVDQRLDQLRRLFEEQQSRLIRIVCSDGLVDWIIRLHRSSVVLAVAGAARQKAR